MPSSQTTQHFQEVLAQYRTAIDSALEDYFASEDACFGLDLKKNELTIFEHLKEFNLRPGKRLRGGLTLFAYDYFSANKKNPSVINAALAVELIQSYLLIIDDVMDRSAMRRGQPTIHKQIQQELPEGQDHLANMLAICAGLVTSHMASGLLMKVKENSRRLVLAQQIFEKNIGITCYGQADDLYNDFAHETEVIRMHQLKNSYYSFISPLQLGAALAGAGDRHTLKQLEAIGLPAGVAFQLKDDILGLFGEEDITGKSSLDDLKEGKFTLLILYTLEHASSGEAEKVRLALGNKNLSSKAYLEVKKIIMERGGLEFASQKAEHYSQLAQERIHSSRLFYGPTKQILLDLVDYVVNRRV